MEQMRKYAFQKVEKRTREMHRNNDIELSIPEQRKEEFRVSWIKNSEQMSVVTSPGRLGAISELYAYAHVKYAISDRNVSLLSRGSFPYSAVKLVYTSILEILR